jgi:hypothetical protein
MIYTAEKFVERVDRRIMAVKPKCADCGILLQETITGNRRTRRGHVCSRCYFKRLGQELDKHPISALRVTRGG